MSLKLLLFVVVAALTAIDAHHFLKHLHKRDLTRSLRHKSPQKAVGTLLRQRRDADEDTSSAEMTDEQALSLLKFFVAAAWEGDKTAVLGGLLEELSDSDTNLTVIGWQRIFDAQGNIKEIKTVQVVIPPKPQEDAPTNVVPDDDDDEDDDRALPQNEINELKEIFEPMAQLGTPGSITAEQFDKEGKLESLLYLDQDELYASYDEFAIYNKTSVASAEEVSKFVAGLKPKALGKPSVLKYDVDGKFLVDQSHVRPHLLGAVNDHYEAPDNILREAPQIIAEISQHYPKKEIPKQLAIHYNKVYPDYKWRVLVDPDNYYVTRDIALDLTYDNFDLDENSYIRYFVYGVKKNTSTK